MDGTKQEERRVRLKEFLFSQKGDAQRSLRFFLLLVAAMSNHGNRLFCSVIDGNEIGKKRHLMTDMCPSHCCKINVSVAMHGNEMLALVATRQSSPVAAMQIAVFSFASRRVFFRYKAFYIRRRLQFLRMASDGRKRRKDSLKSQRANDMPGTPTTQRLFARSLRSALSEVESCT